MRKLNRLWVYVTDRRTQTVEWCPVTLRILPENACLVENIHGDSLEVWNSVESYWKSVVKPPEWATFLLQLDHKGQSCAKGWKRVADVWITAVDETYEALVGNMFTQPESPDPH